MTHGALTEGSLRRLGPWVAVFLLGTAALLNLYSTQPLLTELSEWGAVNDGQAAWTISAATLGVAAMAPIAGSVSDRFGRKVVMMAAIATMMAATLLCALSPSFAWLLLFRLFQGLATPFIFTVAIAYVAEESAPSKTAALNGVYVAGTAFGGFLGRFLAGSVLEIFGSWRLTFVFASAVLLIVACVTHLWLPRETRFMPATSLYSGIRGASEHLRAWRILATCLVGGALLFQQVVSFTFGSIYLTEEPFSLSAMQIGFVFIVFLAPAALTPFVGRAIHRIGTVAIFWSSVVVGAAGIMLTLVPSTPAVITGLALSCISVFAGQSCATGFIGSHAHRSTSASVGLYLTTYYLGGTIGGIIGAPIYLTFGWFGCAVLLLVLIVLSTLAATVAWRKPTAATEMSYASEP